MDDKEARDDLRAIARQNSASLKADRGASLDAQVLTVIRHLLETSNKSSIPIGDIAELFTRAYGKEYDRQVTSRWLGQLDPPQAQSPDSKKQWCIRHPRD